MSGHIFCRHDHSTVCNTALVVGHCLGISNRLGTDIRGKADTRAVVVAGDQSDACAVTHCNVLSGHRSCTRCQDVCNCRSVERAAGNGNIKQRLGGIQELAHAIMNENTARNGETSLLRTLYLLEHECRFVVVKLKEAARDRDLMRDGLHQRRPITARLLTDSLEVSALDVNHTTGKLHCIDDRQIIAELGEVSVVHSHGFELIGTQNIL